MNTYVERYLATRGMRPTMQPSTGDSDWIRDRPWVGPMGLVVAAGIAVVLFFLAYLAGFPAVARAQGVPTLPAYAVLVELSLFFGIISVLASCAFLLGSRGQPLAIRAGHHGLEVDLLTRGQFFVAWSDVMEARRREHELVFRRRDGRGTPSLLRLTPRQFDGAIGHPLFPRAALVE